MLVKFACQNHLSFEREVVLNMIASADTAHEKHVLEETRGMKLRVLRAAALYGANASGKSNLVKAMHFARNFIVNGTERDEQIEVVPFKLRRSRGAKPSKFEFYIRIDGLLYNYGFAATRERVTEEWLYAKGNKGPESMWFERVTKRRQTKLDLGPKLKAKGTKRTQFLEFVGEGTRPNQLFLTEAKAKNVQELAPVFKWFQYALQVITPGAEYAPLAIRAATDREFAESLAKFLRLADTGIDGVVPEMEELDFDRHFPKMPEHARKDLLRNIRDKTEATMVFVDVSSAGGTLTLASEKNGTPIVFRLLTSHRIVEDAGSTVDFETAEESDGTRRWMHLVPALSELTGRETVFVIDELDRSLHPMLAKLFVEYFLNNVSPDLMSQLVFTTHETHLLDLDVLRRDEVWFLEKDKHQSSVLYSLSDFKPRKDLRIEKGYLQGRFGAIPFFGDPSQLGLDSQGPDPDNEELAR